MWSITTIYIYIYTAVTRLTFTTYKLHAWPWAVLGAWIKLHAADSRKWTEVEGKPIEDNAKQPRSKPKTSRRENSRSRSKPQKSFMHGHGLCRVLGLSFMRVPWAVLGAWIKLHAADSWKWREVEGKPIEDNTKQPINPAVCQPINLHAWVPSWREG